ncbi:MAG: hypothetical protein ACK56I_19500, partial [bacterium]
MLPRLGKVIPLLIPLIPTVACVTAWMGLWWVLGTGLCVVCGLPSGCWWVGLMWGWLVLLLGLLWVRIGLLWVRMGGMLLWPHHRWELSGRWGCWVGD